MKNLSLSKSCMMMAAAAMLAVVLLVLTPTKARAEDCNETATLENFCLAVQDDDPEPAVAFDSTVNESQAGNALTSTVVQAEVTLGLSLEAPLADPAPAAPEIVIPLDLALDVNPQNAGAEAVEPAAVSDQPVVEIPPSNVPEEGSLEAPLADPAPAAPEIVIPLDLALDVNPQNAGAEAVEPAAVSDQPVVEIPPSNVPDPYFTRDGTTYHYQSDCTGVDHCTVSNTPIQAALDAMKTGGIGDGVLSLTGGLFTEAIILSGFSSNLTLTGGVDGQETILSGSVTINNPASRITLKDLTLRSNTLTARADAGAGALKLTLSNLVLNNAVVNITGTSSADVVSVDFAPGMGTNALTINTGEGDDTLTVSGAAVIEAALEPGAGVDSVTITAPGARGTVVAGVGNDSIVIANASAFKMIVKNTSDSDAGSLRQAIASAPSGGIITFDPLVFASPATITLASQLTISKDLTIDGAGAAVTLSGNNVTRVFNIASGAAVTLNALSIREGSALQGGGIYNAGILMVTNCDFVGNKLTVKVYSPGGGAIFSSGALTVTNSIFMDNTAFLKGSGYGGAIENFAGPLSISNSLFSGNRGKYGGAIHLNAGSLDIQNSLFSGNTADSGGGIFSSATSMTIANSTFYGNVAADYAGVIYSHSTLTVVNSTFVGNRAAAGAVFRQYTSDPASITNSILAANVGGHIGYRLTDGGNNIDDGDTYYFSAANGSMINTNPLLGDLGHYGGATMTIPLLPDSPAIDAGKANSLTTDQRGVSRVGATDIGAFESRGFTLSVISGGGQLVWTESAFEQPLVVGVASAYGEPVNGGLVRFTAPASGAGLSPASQTTSISNGQASLSGTANAVPGSYAVSAGATGGSTVSFDLTNVQVSNLDDLPALFPGKITFTASGLNLMDFFTVQGPLTLEHRPGSMTLKHTITGLESTIPGYIVTVGGSNMTAFAGLVGLGLKMTNVNFAMGLFISQLGNWLAAKATVESAEFVGFIPDVFDFFQASEDVFDFKASEVAVGVNKAPDQLDDYALEVLENQNTLTVAGAPESLILDFSEGETLQVSVGQGLMKIAPFFHVQGSFAFTKGGSQEAVTVKTEAIPGLSASIELDMDTLLFGGQNLSAFVGYGGLNNDGSVIGGSMGFSLQGLTFGLAIFKPTTLSAIPDQLKTLASADDAPIKFIALKGTALSGSLVGFGDLVTAALYDVEVALNMMNMEAFPYVFPVYVDFTEFEGGSFPIETGADPVVLDFNSALARASVGFFEMQVMTLLHLAGSLAMEAGPTKKFTLSDGNKKDLMILSLGATDVYGILGFGQTGLDVNSDHALDDSEKTRSSGFVGLALRDIDLALLLLTPGLFSQEKYFSLKASVAEVALVAPLAQASASNFTLEANLVHPLGLAVVNFAATFPKEATGVDTDGDGKFGEPAGYEVATGAAPIYLDFSEALVSASGQIELKFLQGNLASLDGDFRFKLTGFSPGAAPGLQVEASLVQLSFPLLPMLPSMTATGSFTLSAAGMYGALAVNTSRPLFEVSGNLVSEKLFNLEGIYQFEFNLTNESQTIKVLNVNTDGDLIWTKENVNTDEDLICTKEAEISSWTVRLAGSMHLTLAAIFKVNGSITLKVSADGFEVNLNGRLILGFGGVDVNGTAIIRLEGKTPIFAASIAVTVALGVSTISITGRGTFEVNTSKTTTYLATTTYPGVAPSAAQVAVNAEIGFELLKVYGEVKIKADGSLFRFEINNLELDFFGFWKVKVSGYVQSDGVFSVSGTLDFSYDFVVLSMNAILSITLSNKATSITLTGSANVAGLAGFKVDAKIELYTSYAYLYLSANFSVDLGFYTIRIPWSWDKVFSWGALPVIARLDATDNTKVYLNMGVDSAERETNGAKLYESITAESVTINGSKNNSITVYALGVTASFSNVTDIVVNDFGIGNDYLYVDKNVTANLTVHGGDDNDTILYNGTGTATIYGDAGKDTLQGGADSSWLYGGSGADTLTGGSGASWLYGETGEDTIQGGSGADTFIFKPGDGADIVAGDAGGSGDTLDFSAYSAALTVTIDSSAANGSKIVSGNDSVSLKCTGIDKLITGSSADSFTLRTYDGGALTLDGASGGDAYLFTGGSGTFTLADSGASDSGSDRVTISSDAASENLTLYGDGFQYQSQRVYAGVDSGLEDITLNLGAGSHAVQIKGSPKAPTTIITGSGNDSFALGDDPSVAQGTGKIIQHMNGNLTLQAGSGVDSLTLDDSAANVERTGSLNATQISGLGMTGVVNYEGFETFVLSLGINENKFTVDQTAASATYRITSGPNQDTFTVNNTASILTLNAGHGANSVTLNKTGAEVDLTTGDDADTVTVSGAPGGWTTIRTGGGNDTVTVKGVGLKAMLIDTGIGDDTLTIDDAGAALTYPGAKVVTNAGDSGPGSLRQAIADSASGGIITFDPLVFASPATITLASQLTISKDLTIDGAGAAVTLSGNNSVRVLEIAGGAAVTLNALTIREGSALQGGGIYNAGILMVTNSDFVGNKLTVTVYSPGGGAIFSSGALTVTNSIFMDNTAFLKGSGYGGAIENFAGPLSISNSLFSGNSGKYGGAIHLNAGSLDIQNSLFSGNTADSGGGIFSSATSMTIANSTFYGNVAADYAGVIYSSSTLTVVNSTFVGNRAAAGAVFRQYTSDPASITNSILAANVGGRIGYQLTDGGNNIDDGNTYYFSAANGSMINTNPLLGDLGHYGGATQTFPLLPGSPAIDAGKANSLTTDQRGAPRVGATDIGAYEYYATAPDSHASSYGDYTLALFTGPNGDTVNLNKTGPYRVILDSGSDNGNDTITLQDLGGATQIVSGDGNDQFTIENPGSALRSFNVTINAGSGDDVFALKKTLSAALTLQGGDGADTFRVSSDASPQSASLGGSLAGMLSSVSLEGGDGSDSLWLSNQAAEAASTAALGATSLTGLLPSGAALKLSGMEVLDLVLGKGADVLTISSLNSDQTATIHGGAGNDVFRLGSATASNLAAIQGVLVLEGDADYDQVSVDLSGSKTNLSGELTAIHLTGLGMSATNNNTLCAAHVKQGWYQDATPCATSSAPAVYYGRRTFTVVNGTTSEALTSTIEQVNLTLGSGADTLGVDSTLAGTTYSIVTGDGDDSITAGSTAAGLHRNSIGRAQYLNGAFQVFGGGGVDTLTIDDAGNSSPSLNGSLNGSIVSGVDDRAGTIQLDSAIEKLVIQLGVQSDTFNVEAVRAGLSATVNLGGGYDTLWVAKNGQNLDKVAGTLTVEGGAPFAQDQLHIDDRAASGNRTYSLSTTTLTNAYTGTDGNSYDLDSSKLTWGSTSASLTYKTTEWVALYAGPQTNTLNLPGTHADRDPLGGANASFTYKGGPGSDTLNAGSGDLSKLSILTMLDGGGGTDTVVFDHSSSSADHALGTQTRQLADLFGKLTPNSEYSLPQATFNDYFNSVLGLKDSSTLLTPVLTRAAEPVLKIGAYLNSVENLTVKLGAGKDTVELLAKGAAENITVYAGGGDDSITLTGSAGLILPGGVKFDGQAGDDTLLVDFSNAVPNSGFSVTFVGGDGGNDVMRILGDASLNGEYTPSSTTARAGTLALRDSPKTKTFTLNFTSLEPIHVQGLVSFQITGADLVTELAIEKVDLGEVALKGLVLHQVLVDGVLSFTQQVRFEGIGAIETLNFGRALAVSGNFMAVGALIKDAGYGVVYVYARADANAAWAEQAKLYPDDRNKYGQSFGSVLALDGGVLAVGAPQEIPNGAVYLYEYGAETGWARQGKYLGVRANDQFGAALAVNAAGGEVYIGAPRSYCGSDADCGSVTILKKNTVWSISPSLILPNVKSSRFGAALAYAGGRLAVGAPGECTVYIFTNDSSTSWTIAQKIAQPPYVGSGTLDFGSALAMNSARLVVGWPGYDGSKTDQGAAFVYDYVGNAWSLSARLTADGGLPESLANNQVHDYDHFGASVALSGNYVAVGVPDYNTVQNTGHYGAAYLFMSQANLPNASNSGSSWLRSKDRLGDGGLKDDLFGSALAFDGVTLVVGVPGYDKDPRMDLGELRFFTTNGDYTLTNPYEAERVSSPFTGDMLQPIDAVHAGQEVLYHAPSKTLLVAAPGAGTTDPGKVLVFKDEGLTWRLDQELGGQIGNPYGFGYDMDLVDNLLAVGGPYSNQGAGGVWFFSYDFAAAEWKHLAGTSLEMPNASNNLGAHFGASVALVKDESSYRLAVGAPDATVWYDSTTTARIAKETSVINGISYIAGVPFDDKITLSSIGAVFTYTSSISSISWTYGKFIMPYDSAMPEQTSTRTTAPPLYRDSSFITNNEIKGKITLPDSAYAYIYFYNSGQKTQAFGFGKTEFTIFDKLMDIYVAPRTSAYVVSHDGANYGTKGEVCRNDSWDQPMFCSRGWHFDDIFLSSLPAGFDNPAIPTYDQNGVPESVYYVGGKATHVYVDGCGYFDLFHNGSIGNWDCDNGQVHIAPHTLVVMDTDRDHGGDFWNAVNTTNNPQEYGATGRADQIDVMPFYEFAAYYDTQNTTTAKGYRFGASLDWNGTSLSIGAPGNGRMYTVGNAASSARYSAWATNFGAPVRAGTYTGNLTGINDVLTFQKSDRWSTADHSLAASGVYLLRTQATGNVDSGLYNESGAKVADFPAVPTATGSNASPKHASPAFAGEGRYVFGLEGDNRFVTYRSYAPAWIENKTLTLSPAAPPPSEYGYSVAIDGATAVVGAPGYDGRGAVYVFSRPAEYSDACDNLDLCGWELEGTLQGSDIRTGDRFGASVDISVNTLIIGAPNAGSSDQGAAYFFARSNDRWSLKARFTGTGLPATAQFGAAVALFGDTAVVGAPGVGAVYSYYRSGFDWKPAQIYGPASNSSYAWQDTRKSNYAFASGFGAALALDGARLAVGQPNADTAYLFTYSASSAGLTFDASRITLSGTKGSRFGASLALDGQHLAVGAPDFNQQAGQVLTYLNDNGSWTPGTALDVVSQAGDQFGASVSLSGKRLVVGAPGFDATSTANSGAVYALGFKRSLADQAYRWLNETVEGPLQGSGALAGDGFGRAVAISGMRVLSGAPRFVGPENSLSGNGYVHIVQLSQPLSVLVSEVVSRFQSKVIAQKISGSMGGRAISELVFYNISGFTIQTGNQKDKISLSADGLAPYGLNSFTAQTGAGDDTFEIQSRRLSLPTEGQLISGSTVTFSDKVTSAVANDLLAVNGASAATAVSVPVFQFQAGAGAADTLQVSAGEVMFTLQDSQLSSADGGAVTFTGVETLAGGPERDLFTILKWVSNQLITFKGGAGSDEYYTASTAIGASLAFEDNNAAGEQNLLNVAGTDGNDTLIHGYLTAVETNLANLVDLVKQSNGVWEGKDKAEYLYITTAGLSSPPDYWPTQYIDRFVFDLKGGNDRVKNLACSAISIDGGGGDDVYEIHAVETAGEVILDDSEPGGADQVHLVGSDEPDQISIGAEGASVNTLSIRYSNSFDAFTVEAGGGNDQMSVENFNAAALTLQGGAGSDQITINSVEAGGISIDGGAGADSYAFDHLENLTGMINLADSGASSTEEDIAILMDFNPQAIGTLQLNLTGLDSLLLQASEDQAALASALMSQPSFLTSLFGQIAQYVRMEVIQSVTQSVTHAPEEKTMRESKKDEKAGTPSPSLVQMTVSFNRALQLPVGREVILSIPGASLPTEPSPNQPLPPALVPSLTQVSIPANSGENARLSFVALERIPGTLPSGTRYFFALEIAIQKNNVDLAHLEAENRLGVTFILPSSFKGKQWEILYWNQSESRWDTFSPTLSQWDPVLGTRVYFQTRNCGLFLLVERVQPDVSLRMPPGWE